MGIDSNKVYGAGNSAGSIMAIHVAYLDEYERVNFPALSSTPDLGCLSCSGNAYQTGAVPKAIANLWGAIIDTAFIEVSNNVPAISFHGDQDGLVSPTMHDHSIIHFSRNCLGLQLFTSDWVIYL
ncbi:MAG: hypothetical protein GWO75_00095 [Bacteroidetes bacterium]|nr:hypothetical protein [Bacteroidota bacterium]